MKSFLEHLVSQTVPHDMIEELHNAGVTFYEGLSCGPFMTRASTKMAQTV